MKNTSKSEVTGRQGIVAKLFSIHWILLPSGKRILLPKNSMDALPNVGDELRASPKSFYTVVSIVWCLDEKDEFGQRVNIGIKKSK